MGPVQRIFTLAFFSHRSLRQRNLSWAGPVCSLHHRPLMKKLKWFIFFSVILVTAATWGTLDLVYRSTLNFSLYKDEAYWGGSRQTELLSFMEAGREIVAAQSKIAAGSKDKVRRRVFHAKQHGCLTGKLVLYKDRPQDQNHETYEGLFDPSRQESYDVIVRFSNGLGTVGADSKPDVRGAAIKVVGVTNSQTGEKQTVDLLMTNSPVPFGKDFLEFVDFMKETVAHGPTLGTLFFKHEHPDAGSKIFSATGLLPYHTKSLATQRYWSGHPYLMGNGNAVKFNIIPEQKNNLPLGNLIEMGGNYLRKDLRWRTMKGGVKFTVAVQLEKDLHSTPIENQLQEWTEAITPSIAVGELILDQQDFAQTEIDQTCESMRFTPGHYIPENRPLSNMGRGRLFAYEASQIGRGASEQEPDETVVQHWRDLNKVSSNQTSH